MTLKINIQNEMLKLSENFGYKENQYRVTELCYCLRKAYYNRKFNKSSKLNGAMLSGQLMHEKFVELTYKIPEFKGAKFEVPCETKMNGFKIDGRADITTDTSIYELKYAKIFDVNTCPMQYVLQANAYCNMLKKKNFSIIIIDNRFLDVEVYSFNKNSLLYQDIKDNAKILHNSLHAKYDVLPDGPAYGFECSYCEHYVTCRVSKTEIIPIKK